MMRLSRTQKTRKTLLRLSPRLPKPQKQILRRLSKAYSGKKRVAWPLFGRKAECAQMGCQAGLYHLYQPTLQYITAAAAIITVLQNLPPHSPCGTATLLLAHTDVTEFSYSLPCLHKDFQTNHLSPVCHPTDRSAIWQAHPCPAWPQETVCPAFSRLARSG